ncbi:sensor histidine kinase [Brachybacterium sp. YJGR34]|uniref:sensor histidine kinase n=1 Tax=Brachybacterium sp. YJGR34 TaxID=2059911 RepID=UPI000E0BF4D7|nr:histidine kinase [Brachybacterium sp. YJGR34]
MSSSVVPDPAQRPRIGRMDVLTAGGYAVVSMVLALSGVSNNGVAADGPLWGRGVSVVLLLLGCASVLWRRRRPVVVLAAAGPLGLAEIIGGGQIGAYFLLFEALFCPVMHGSRRLAQTTTGIAIAVCALLLAGALVAGVPGPMVLLLGMLVALVAMTPLLWGWEVRHHREARRAAEQLVGLEHELAETRAAHAVETERRSIAHDLHDVIAGHLSAVSLHTNLASSLEDPAARDRSLVTARESAHAALRDLRSMIGVLADEGAGAQPEVTLDWPSLTARLRGRDPAASIHIDPAVTDPAQVDPSVQAALLRIGAESVTNAVRHGAAPISLEVRVQERSVTVDLCNRRASEDSPGTGVGRGAIAHRANAVGGSAASAPEGGSAAGTWRVHARLPARHLADPGLSPTVPEESHS